MAATVPYRVSDLIRTYGWTIMPYLSALGIDNLAEVQVLFVDSGATEALDADDGYHGHSFKTPLATIAYASSLCTASEGAIVLAAPGHNENLGDAQINPDVAGVKFIGIGEGTLRPRIDFDHANSSIDIGANDIRFVNFGFLPSITSVLVGVDVETGVTNFKMLDCEFMIGEDGSGADEFVKAIALTSGNHDCVFENVKILAHASAAQATHGIHVVAASNRLTFKNVIIDGPYATGGIVEAAAGVNHVVEDCAVDVTGTNYSFHGSSTFAKRVRNQDGTVVEDDAESLMVLARGTGAYPTGITDNSILAYILGSGATASASTFDNSTDSLQAIAAAVAAYTDNVSIAVPEPPTAKSLHDTLHKDGSYTFDNTTDSLEAISDALALGTGVQTVLETNNLDNLLKTSTSVAADGDLSGHVVTGSILAHIMAAGADVTTAYNASTDSLSAIAAALAAGTGVQTVVETNSLDHLMKTTTGVAADADLESYAVAGTLMAHIMGKAADVTTFQASTDSLEAISDKINTAQADLNILTGASGANLLTATQNSIDAIEADTAVIEPGAKRIAIKASGSMIGMDSGEVLFTVTGAVLARVCGIPSTKVTSTSGTTTLEVGVAGNTALLCVQDAADGTAFDANFCWTKTIAADAPGAELADEWVVIPGGLDIILTISADDLTAGVMDFYCEWIPLSTNGNVVTT